jgi:hypothetical protein
MKRFTDAGRLSIGQGNLYAALSLALMIPDICASLEDPGPGKSQKRYERWCKEWVEPKFTGPPQGSTPARVFISAEDCYQLRCSLIHSGSAEIAAGKQNVFSRFEFFDQSTGSHLTWYEDNILNGVKQPNFLQLKADRFSEELFKAATEWDAAMAGNASVQSEKSKLLVIRTKGDVAGGVKFT